MEELNETVKLVVFIPEMHADAVQSALGESGAGKIGNYKYCTFSVKGTGRYIPEDAAHPFIGKVGVLDEVIEERIETVCYKKDLDTIINAVRKVHPYEEVAFDVYPLILNPHKTTHS